MSIRQYPVFEQGAVIRPENFIPRKLILAYIEEMGSNISEETIEKLNKDAVDEEAMEELCEEFCIDDASDCSEIATELWDELKSLLENNGILGSERVKALFESGIDAQFFPQALNAEGYSLDECILLAFHVPLAWDDSDRQPFPSSYDEAMHWLKEAGNGYLDPEMEWESHIGILVGHMFG